MEYNHERVHAAEQRLAELIGPQLAEVTEAILERPEKNPYFVQLPDTDVIDLPIEVIAGLVARSSNNFARVARFAGIARAEAKLARGRYERKFKRLRGGGLGATNDKAREAAAMTECQTEHIAMTNADAVAEIADALEAAARIASESSRKLLDKSEAMLMGNVREQRGRDFQTY